MNCLQEIIFKEYGLRIELKPFGDNHSKNNVFLGDSCGNLFIVKIESIKQIEQVKIAIKIAQNLIKSDMIVSSNYIQAISGEFLVRTEDEIITVQEKEDVESIIIKDNDDLLHLGEAVGEFHRGLLEMNLEELEKSDFYKDFMGNEIPQFQSKERLENIKEFYNLYSPNYKMLTKGVVHNDLNSNNIFRLGQKFFIIDFEHLKYCPLVSDLGVLILEFWDKNKGIDDYLLKSKIMLEGYARKIKLNEYDRENIIVFSLRYLFSDENWYHYWSLNGNSAAKDLIPEIIEKQLLLLELMNKG